MPLCVRGRAVPGTPSPTGNLLRFARRPAYVVAVLAAWCARHGGTPQEALDLARAADLWALIDLAARAGDNPIADRAHAHLVAIARTGDLHALPATADHGLTRR